jgi:carbon storage regulator
MLVLTRHPDQKIIIGDDIEITVLGMAGKQVKLGIEAPSHVTIHREEIYKKIQEQNNG